MMTEDKIKQYAAEYIRLHLDNLLTLYEYILLREGK